MLSTCCCVGFSVVAVSRGCSLTVACGLLIAVASLLVEHWLLAGGLLVAAPGLWSTGSSIVIHRLVALSLVQGSNSHLLHCLVDSLSLSYQGNPSRIFFFLIAQQHGSELWAWLSWVLCVPNEVFNLGYFLRWLSHLKSWLGGDPLPSSLKSLLSGFPSSWAAGLKASVSPCLSTRGFLWFSVTWVSLQASLQQVACRVRERRHNNTVRSMSKTEDRHLLPNLGSDIPSARFSLLETSTMSIYTQRENVSQGHEY